MMDSSVVVGSAIMEPCNEMEFESHEAAYAFYKEYAKSAGFGTAKLSSRRSRASREFIDAKFSCIRYGNKQQSDDAINPRPSPKIGCKASMHVKRRQDGKWYVYSFVKEHNHELLPAQAHFFRSHRSSDPISNDVRMRRRKSSTAVSKLFSAYQNVDCLENFAKHQRDRGRSLVLEAGHAQVLLELFMHMQEENPKFFYAVDFNEDHRLRNVFWVDAKGLEDFAYFADAVCLDTTYFTSKYKIPLVLFIGVNHHIQPILLGCALIADETVYTFAWLLHTWFIAMGERAPPVILTDQSDAIKAAVAAVLPGTRHCFCLWHIFDKIPKQLEFLSTWRDAFMKKFNKCIYKSWTEEQFEKRWWKLVDRFNLRDVEWVQALYDDRTCWVPTFMRDISFAGLSTNSRSESLNSLFDNYVQADISLREFIEQYKVILEDRHEEEAKANFDAWHETPELKSPSPFEKQMLFVYTHEIYKKFQAEVLGAVACHLKKDNDDAITTYTVKDFENNESYMVEWNTSNSDICCSCRSFEYKGYLCRHAIVVLQMSGVFNIPPKYILQRWTNAAMSRHPIGEKLEEVQSKVRRFNDLCRRAIVLGEEGSLSLESYYIALGSLNEAFTQCANLSNPAENDTRPDASTTLVICNVEEDYQSVISSNNKFPDPKLNTSNKAVKTIVAGRDQGSTENSDGNKEKVPQLEVVSGKDGFQPTESSDHVSSHNVMPMQFHSMVPALFHNHNISSIPFYSANSSHLHPR